MMEIRRYLYGDLTEETLRKYMNGTFKVLSFKGIMSFYPLITDIKLLKKLDRWLLSTILNVIELRRKMLLTNNPNIINFKPPFNLNKDELLMYCKKTIIRDKALLEIPSFLRIYNALNFGVNNYGVEAVMNPKSLYY